MQLIVLWIFPLNLSYDKLLSVFIKAEDNQGTHHNLPFLSATGFALRKVYFMMTRLFAVKLIHSSYILA